MKGEANMSDTSAADVIRAHELMRHIPPEERDEFCAILRRCIIGLSPEQADKALVELFQEIEICDEVMMETDRGFLSKPY
jgi:hypothetical protein